MSGPLELALAAFAEKAGNRANDVVRKVVIDVTASVVDKSPVGNPDLWKENEAANYARETYNLFAPLVGAKTLTARTLRKKFKNQSVGGYAGGRFRANWTMQEASVDDTTTEAIDAGGQATKDRLAAAVPDKAAGRVYFIANSLPYAQALEYGHSTQAPGGMVGLTAIEFQGFVDRAVASLSQ